MAMRNFEHDHINQACETSGPIACSINSTSRNVIDDYNQLYSEENMIQNMYSKFSNCGPHITF